MRNIRVECPEIFSCVKNTQKKFDSLRLSLYFCGVKITQQGNGRE